jgi:hypothetical protein
MPGECARIEIMSRIAQRIILILALVALVAALARFAQLRFQTGELYPAYSTLRSDPVGAKALFESLRQLENALVRRNVEPLERLKTGRGTTMVFLGIDGSASSELYDVLPQIARNGGRVVVAFDARGSRTPGASRKFIVTPPLAKGATNTNVVLRDSPAALLDLDLRMLDLPDTNRVEAVRVSENGELPETMLWSGYYQLIPKTNDWEIIYEAKGKPVVLERKLGLGSVVAMADSFLFSNEAMHIARAPAFLLWALGNGQITFDETHLGVHGGSGIAVLMREFRLHGLAAGCLLLVGLWVWRNSAPFVPPPPPAQLAVAESIEGKTAREGIVHLLRRNLTDVDVLRAGLEEWAKAHPSNEYWQMVRLNEARKLAESYGTMPKPRSLAAMQREISKILFPKRN